VNKVIRIEVDNMPQTSALIAKSHALMRHALVALLREARPDWNCEDVDGLDELRGRIQSSSPTLVLIDLPLCGLDGLRQLRVTFPHTTFVVLSDQDDRAAILACLEAGAQGYILKSTSPDQFVRALETILTGGLYAPASLSGMPIHPPVAPQRTELRMSPLLSHLTERQRHVFELLAEGCATKPSRGGWISRSARSRFIWPRSTVPWARRAGWKPSPKRTAPTRRRNCGLPGTC
jgi:DNA-binding NarL/FixJ family response regulator